MRHRNAMALKFTENDSYFLNKMEKIPFNIKGKIRIIKRRFLTQINILPMFKRLSSLMKRQYEIHFKYENKHVFFFHV